MASQVRMLQIVNLTDIDYHFENKQFGGGNGVIKAKTMKWLDGDSQLIPWRWQTGRPDYWVVLKSASHTWSFWQESCNWKDRLRYIKGDKAVDCNGGAQVIPGDSNASTGFSTTIVIGADHSLRSHKNFFKDTMCVWATPTSVAIADHTWVTGTGKGSRTFCEGATWGTNGVPDSYYCKGRWSNGVYQPLPEWRLLNQGPGAIGISECIPSGPIYKDPLFPFIPRQGDITYGINGVCHQLTNRTLYGSKLSAMGAGCYGLSQFVYGFYGTHVPIFLLSLAFSAIGRRDLIPHLGRAASLATRDWLRRRNRCRSGFLPKVAQNRVHVSPFIRSLDYLHIHDDMEDTEESQVLTRDDLEKLLVAANRVHLQEVELKMRFHGTGIDMDKLKAIQKHAADTHRVNEELLDQMVDGAGELNLVGEADFNLTEAEVAEFAKHLNQQTDQAHTKIYGILGETDYKRLYGNDYNKDLNLINPEFY